MGKHFSHFPLISFQLTEQNLLHQCLVSLVVGSVVHQLILSSISVKILITFPVRYFPMNRTRGLTSVIARVCFCVIPPSACTWYHQCEHLQNISCRVFSNELNKSTDVSRCTSLFFHHYSISLYFVPSV